MTVPLNQHSVVQPCRQSPHVATGTFTVATSTTSSISYLWVFLKKNYVSYQKITKQVLIYNVWPKIKHQLVFFMCSKKMWRQCCLCRHICGDFSFYVGHHCSSLSPSFCKVYGIVCIKNIRPKSPESCGNQNVTNRLLELVH